MNGPEVADELNDVFFGEIQAQIESITPENPDGMNYKRYAEVLWQRLGLSLDDERFGDFQSDLITNMNEIQMDDLVNLSQEALEGNLNLPGKHILWSRGDSSPEHTGYQRVKFLKSKIGLMVEDVLGKSSVSPSEFLETAENQGEVKFGDTEMGWIVAEDKNSELEGWLDKNDHISQIVVIEDSISNLDTVISMGKEHGIDVIPIWFNNSRAGKKMEDSGDTEKLAERNQKYNGIDDLAKIPGLLKGKTTKDTLFLWDLDGVLCDNIEMRPRQTEAKINAILKHTDLTNKEEIAKALRRAS